MRAFVLVAVVACSSPQPTAVITKPATPQVPMSDPAEYTIERISRDAGKAIFAKTGIGDPYRTGVPYPIFLALVAGYPKTFGGSLDALAGKFGFVARTPNPSSKDL